MVQSRRLSTDVQLQKVTAAAPLARGSTGSGVAAVQDLLADLGFALPRSVTAAGADGVFGPETVGAVKEFQRRSGLKADGFVGPKTLAALDAIILRNPSLELPSAEGEAAVRLFDAAAPLSARRTAYF